MSRSDRDTEKNERIAELEAAIRGIVNAWEDGDLAGAVNNAAGLLPTAEKDTLAEQLRARLQEYDDTMATPGQAQDIAEADLLHDVRAIVDSTISLWAKR